jgi:hypothetical protein
VGGEIAAQQDHIGRATQRLERPRHLIAAVLRALHVAAALRNAHVPFVLGGSLAAWARGGPSRSTTST